MESENKKTNILLAEDEADLREIYTQKLQSEGFAIAAVENGKEALGVIDAQASNIDLILLDIVMPEMDGFDVLRKIKDNKKYAQIPVVMLTSLSDYDDRKEAFRLGAKKYFVKPDKTPAQLAAEIREVLAEGGLAGSTETM